LSNASDFHSEHQKPAAQPHDASETFQSELSYVWNMSQNIAIGAGKRLKTDIAEHPLMAAGEVALGAAALTAAVLAAPEVGAAAAAGSALIGLGELGTVVSGVAQAAWMSVPFAGLSTSAYKHLGQANGKTTADQNILLHPGDHSPAEIAQAKKNIQDNFGQGALEGAFTAAGVLGVTGLRVSGLPSASAKPVELPLSQEAPPAAITDPTSAGSANPTATAIAGEGPALHSGTPTIPDTTSGATYELPDNRPAVPVRSTEAQTIDWSTGPDLLRSVLHLDEVLPKARNEPLIRDMQAVRVESDAVALARSDLKGEIELQLLDRMHFPQMSAIMKKINNPEYMSKVIQDYPEISETYSAYRKLDEPKSKVLEAIEPRRKAIEDRLNLINQERGLPPVRVEPTFEIPDNGNAQYLRGTIQLPAEYFAGSRSPDDLTEILRHEDEHHVQRCLACAAAIEDAVGSGPLLHSDVSTMQAHMNGSMTPEQIRAVDAARTGADGNRILLNPAERARSDALKNSFSDQRESVLIGMELANIRFAHRKVQSDPVEALHILAAKSEDFAVPDFLKPVLTPEQARYWPVVPQNFALDLEGPPLEAFKQSFEDYLSAKERELSAAHRGAYSDYRGRAHEQEAWRVGAEAGKLARALQNPFQAFSRIFEESSDDASQPSPSD
jgi:hypothetical protein